MKTNNFKQFVFSTLLSGVVLVTFSSCQFSEVKNLSEENENLKNAIIQSDSLQIQFMNAYAEIECNLNEIKVREKMISKNSDNAEDNTNVQEKILNDIAEIGNLMEKNRKKIRSMDAIRGQLITSKKQNVDLTKENKTLKNTVANLKKAAKPAAIRPINDEKIKDYENQNNLLKQNNLKFTEVNKKLIELNKSLEQTIGRLKNQIAESEARIESLQEELSLLKEAYVALQAINDSIAADNLRYIAELKSKDLTIEELTDIASNAYYLVSPEKELKSKKIIVKKSLNPNFKNNIFVKIDNINEKRVIETKSSKVTIMSVHPSSSYTINKTDKKNYKIEIKNPDQFWGKTKYLIVATK